MESEWDHSFPVLKCLKRTFNYCLLNFDVRFRFSFGCVFDRVLTDPYVLKEPFAGMQQCFEQPSQNVDDL